MADFVRRHTTLTSGFRLAGEHFRRFAIDGDDVRFEPADHGYFASPAAITTFLGREFDERATPFGWPSYVLAAVVRKTSSTLIVAYDHINIDNYSLAVAIHELPTIYEAQLQGVDHRLRPAHDFVELCAAERNGAFSEQLPSALARWRAFLELGQGSLPTSPMDLGLASGERCALINEEIHLLDDREAADFERWCRFGGGSFFAGIMAVFALCMREWRPDPVVALLVPLQMRTDLRVPAIGWYANPAPIWFTIPDDGDPVKILRGAYLSSLEAREHRMIPIEMVERDLGTWLDAPNASWLSYVDFRRLPGADSYEERDVRLLTNERQGSGVDYWAHRTTRGVTMQVRYPRTPAARNSVHTFVGALADRMRAMTSA